ncbi:hypothetical protein [Maricaulis sp.]|uniref:hypothetical protein n=1 Tax=Maricaulis sp. TaxID=1486257 RepID=UPI00329852A2
MIPFILIIAAVLIAGITEYSARRERVDWIAAAAIAILGRVVAAILFVVGLIWALVT